MPDTTRIPPSEPSGSDRNASYKVDVMWDTHRGDSYVFAEEKHERPRDGKATWVVKNGQEGIHLLDVLDIKESGGHMSDVQVDASKNKITATITFDSDTAPFTYNLLVWTKEWGLCLAYGEGLAQKPECQVDNFTTPDPPPRIEPPDDLKSTGSGTG